MIQCMQEPFIWVIAMVFDIWRAFAIIFIATTAGMALPYIMARYYMKTRASSFLERYKHTKVVLTCVERAGPFKVSLLVRLGPLPYSVENYGKLAGGGLRRRGARAGCFRDGSHANMP